MSRHKKQGVRNDNNYFEINTSKTKSNSFDSNFNKNNNNNKNSNKNNYNNKVEMSDWNEFHDGDDDYYATKTTKKGTLIDAEVDDSQEFGLTGSHIDV
jgi:aspartyl aminopeptidase